MSQKPNNRPNQLLQTPIDATHRSKLPTTTRLALEIPKPKNWQDFQRNCVVLFRCELSDPHTQEYGRSGQKQSGIDIIGRRGADDDNLVGIQCRLITKPITFQKMLKDSRAALTIKAGLKELIFATTAPDDTTAADAAIEVTRQLKSEGYNLRVVVYGWGQLQTIIALHELAYNVFNPSALGISTSQTTAFPGSSQDFAELVASTVLSHFNVSGVKTLPTLDRTHESEDPALHARIDIYRDLFKDQGESLLAKEGLVGLQDKVDQTTTPWASYRIETNLGAIALDLGDQQEAARRFESAYQLRPNDPNALANYALAETINERFDSAMNAARAALSQDDKADHAITYLLQAAARSEYDGNPEELIPDFLIDTPHADLGLAEFYRQRLVEGWELKCLQLSRKHEDQTDFKSVRSFAILSLAVSSLTGASTSQPEYTKEELWNSSEDMLNLVEKNIRIGYVDQHDFSVHLNNAAILLRICERYAVCESLLKRGIPLAEDMPQLRLLLSISCAAQGREVDALRIIEDDKSYENQIFKIELLATTGDLETALQSALNLRPGSAVPRLEKARWSLAGEIALKLSNTDVLQNSIEQLKALDPNDIAAKLLELKSMDSESSTSFVDKLKQLSSNLDKSIDFYSRYLMAATLEEADLPEEAVSVLSGYVDIHRPNPALNLYLRCLASSRLDHKFFAALDQIPKETRETPTVLWMMAAHAWNAGDLTASMTHITSLLKLAPNNASASLMRIEILIRQNNIDSILDELSKPLETADWTRLTEKFRLALLLNHFGFTERAAKLSYQLFLQHRDLSRAWLNLSMLVLEEGRDLEPGQSHLSITQVSANSAVNLSYDDGSSGFFVVEPDIELRRLDPDSWEPNHPLIKATLNCRVNDRFTAPDGRTGTVNQIRHKYVARFHYVLEHYQNRFPNAVGFERVLINPDHPDGLDGLLNRVKEHHDWVAELENEYHNTPMPLAILAHRVGRDTIEVAGGIAGHGAQIRASTGDEAERLRAAKYLRRNRRRGCVLDLLTFWSAWKTGALEALKTVAGPIHLPQSVLDRLHERKNQFSYSIRDGIKTAGYRDGGFVLYETPAETVAHLKEETELAISWAENNSSILPVIATDELNQKLREFLRRGNSDVFDSLILAREKALILITNDLFTRQLDEHLGEGSNAWLADVYDIAFSDRVIDANKFISILLGLKRSGYGYLGVSGQILAEAARLDFESNDDDENFRSLCSLVGGAEADPASHILVVLTFMDITWSDHRTVHYREHSTGHLLECLIRGRVNDYIPMLQNLVDLIRKSTPLYYYVKRWLEGHFIAQDVLRTSAQ